MQTAADIRPSQRFRHDFDPTLGHLYHLEVSHGADFLENPAVSISGVEVSDHVASLAVHQTHREEEGERATAPSRAVRALNREL
jgi:hypothetical protein